MKTFRKVQKKEWENNYFDYKSLKHYIKENLNNKNNEVLNNLTLKIDKEVRKIFVFYMNQESKIYVSINQCLHNEINYIKYDEFHLSDELNILAGISILLYDLIIYIKYNILALQKILKKIDKKFISITNKTFTGKYLGSKINNDGSDINYIFKFKIINEVIPLIEDLKNKIQTSLNNLNSNESFTKKSSNNIQSILLIKETHNLSLNNNKSIKTKIEDYIKVININQGKIENPYRNLENIYKVWVIEYPNVNESTFDLNIINEYGINDNTKSINNSENYETILSFNKRNYKKNFFILNLCFILYGIIEFIILTDDKTFKNKNDNLFSYKKMAIIFICCPIGMIFLSVLSICIKIYSFKNYVFLSVFFSLIGSMLYCFNYNIFFNVIGIFFIGLSINKNLLIKYIITYFPNKKINKTLEKRNIYNFIGIILSRILIIISININKHLNNFNEIVYSSFICVLLSFIILIMIRFKFKVNKKDLKFSFLNNNINKSLNKTSELNEKLNKINIEQNYNSADLINKSIQEIIRKTIVKNKLIFILFCLIQLITTSTFYSFLLFIPINFTLEKLKLEIYIIFYLLIVLICNNIFTFISKKLTQPRNLLIPLIISNISIILIYLFINKNNNFISYILIGVILIISYLLSDFVLRLYENIIIVNYKKFTKNIYNYIFYLSGIFGIIIGYGNFYFFQKKELHVKILCIGYSSSYIVIFVYTMFIYQSLKVSAIQRFIKMNDINVTNSNTFNL